MSPHGGRDGNAARLSGLLEKLIVYYQGVLAETARFTRDAEFLRQVAQQAAERQAAIRALIALLSRERR